MSGQQFSHEVTGIYRWVRLTVLPSGKPASSQELEVFGVGSPIRSRWWEATSGVQRFFLKLDAISLTTVTGELDPLRSEGVHVVELFAPYAGPADVWGGLGANGATTASTRRLGR